MRKLLIFLLVFTVFSVHAQKKVTVKVEYAKEVSMDASLSADCWQKAVKYPLMRGKYNTPNYSKAKRKNVGTQLRNPGYVQFLWDDNNLYVAAMMEDGDVVAEGEADQTHLYRLGDTIEVFLKPKDKNYYWEIYGTPNLKKSVFFYPSRGRLFVPSCAVHPVDVTVAAEVYGTLNNYEDQDKGWSLIIAIPIEMLERKGYAFRPGQEWTVLVARQNYSADLPAKELSVHTPLSIVDFHLYEEYGDLILLPAKK